MAEKMYRVHAITKRCRPLAKRTYPYISCDCKTTETGRKYTYVYIMENNPCCYCFAPIDHNKWETRGKNCEIHSEHVHSWQNVRRPTICAFYPASPDDSNLLAYELRHTIAPKRSAATHAAREMPKSFTHFCHRSTQWIPFGLADKMPSLIQWTRSAIR